MVLVRVGTWCMDCLGILSGMDTTWQMVLVLMWPVRVLTSLVRLGVGLLSRSVVRWVLSGLVRAVVSITTLTFRFGVTALTSVYRSWASGRGLCIGWVSFICMARSLPLTWR